MQETIRSLNEQDQIYAYRRGLRDKDHNYLIQMIFQLGREVDRLSKESASSAAYKRSHQDWEIRSERESEDSKKINTAIKEVMKGIDPSNPVPDSPKTQQSQVVAQ